MKKEYRIMLMILLSAIVLAVISWILLPNRVVCQISINALNPTTLPKVLAVAISFLLMALGGIFSVITKDDLKRYKKSLFVSGIGAFSFIMLLIINIF